MRFSVAALLVAMCVVLAGGCHGSTPGLKRAPDATANRQVGAPPSGECVGSLEGGGLCPPSPEPGDLQALCRAGVADAYAQACGAGRVVRLTNGFVVWRCHYAPSGKLIGALRTGCIPDEDCTVGTVNGCDLTPSDDGRDLI